MTICGIDPGTKGGIAFIYADSTAEGFPLPYDGNALDVIELRDLFEGVSRVYVEKPMILRGQGGAMTIGANYGRILATAALSHISLREVSPNTWKSKLLGKTESKGAAVALAKRLYPMVELVQPGCRTEHDGVAEALLIAEYGRRHG